MTICTLMMLYRWSGDVWHGHIGRGRRNVGIHMSCLELGCFPGRRLSEQASGNPPSWIVRYLHPWYSANEDASVLANQAYDVGQSK